MYNLIDKLFKLLTRNQVRRFYFLQLLVICSALLEVVGVASIIPFMTLVGDQSLLQKDTFIAEVFQLSGVKLEHNFIIMLGIGVLIMLFVSSVISIATTWRIAMFANSLGAEISDRLFKYYIMKEWLFHASGSSAQLTKKVANEATRLTSNIILPLLQLNARITLALSMSIMIFLYDPKVAIIGIVAFSLAYFVLFKLIRKRLDTNSRSISRVLEERFRLMNECFGGIKDLLLLGRHDNYISKFELSGKSLASSLGTNSALAIVPRYFIELVAFGSLISLLLYLMISHDGNLSYILPILSVYAFAGFKLLPNIQQIYSNLVTIKGNLSAFESIEQDLKNSSKIDQKENQNFKQDTLNPKKVIALENITFKYSNRTEPTLNKLSMSIPVNKVIGIVGSSGSGKSTLIDILIGLLTIQEGELKIDGVKLLENDFRKWQNTIGYVPQSIFLSEGSIAENVAFGLSVEEINYEQVDNALRLANLSQFINSLYDGVHTKVGERGVQLSGGQRQRIGIARALYNSPDILIFDEATSALDGNTEKLIINAIDQFSANKTIIMIAHRLKTVEKCDQIFFLENGCIVDSGSYSELIQKNIGFKELANHS